MKKGFIWKSVPPRPPVGEGGRKKYIFWFFNRRHKIWAENQHNSVQIQDADIIIFCSLTLLSKKIPWLPRTVRSALHLSIISELQCSLKTSWSPCTVDENNISQPFFNWVYVSVIGFKIQVSFISKTWVSWVAMHHTYFEISLQNWLDHFLNLGNKFR